MDTQERSIVFFSSGSHFFSHFYMLIFPALLMPISRDLGLPLSRVINISFAMYLLYGFLATGWGFISDHWGHKPAMSAGLIVAGLGMTLGGLVGTSSLGPITLSFTLVGVGCAAYHPSGLALISQGVRQRGRAMGINGVWGNIGVAAVPFTVGLLNYLIGWQRGILILGLLGMVLGLAGLFAPLSIPRGQERAQPEPGDRNATPGLFLAFALVVVFLGLMTQTYTLVLPAFLEGRLGDATATLRRLVPGLEGSPALQTLTANLFTTLIYVLGIFGQALGGRTADRYDLKGSFLVFLLIAFPFAMGLALLQGGWLILPAGIFVFFTFGSQPIENILVATLSPPRWRSVSYGLKFTLTFGVGAFAVRMAGWVEQRSGLNGVIWMAVLFLFLALLAGCFFLLAGRGRRAAPETA